MSETPQQMQEHIDLLRALLPTTEDEIAAALVGWAGNGGNEARSVLFRHANGQWKISLAEEHTYRAVEEPTLGECWERLKLSDDLASKETTDHE